MAGLNEFAQWYYLIYLLPGGEQADTKVGEIKIPASSLVVVPVPDKK